MSICTRYAIVLLCTCTPLGAQQSNRLQCQGVMGDTPAVLSGVRQYAPHNALGDGFVRFGGTVTAGGISARMIYEGFTRTAPFDGVIETPQGPLQIAVLDNTGGRMIIYGGAASLGPPTTIGEFICRWQ